MGDSLLPWHQLCRREFREPRGSEGVVVHFGIAAPDGGGYKATVFTILMHTGVVGKSPRHVYRPYQRAKH